MGNWAVEGLNKQWIGREPNVQEIWMFYCDQVGSEVLSDLESAACNLSACNWLGSGGVVVWATAPQTEGGGGQCCFASKLLVHWLVLQTRSFIPRR